MRQYEAMYIVDPNVADEDIDPVILKYSKVVTDNGGTIGSAIRWERGRRQLAYSIKGHSEGTYIQMLFDSEPGVPKELDRIFRINDEILRHLIQKYEPPKPPKGGVRAQSQDEAPAPEATPAAEAVAEAAPVAEAPVAVPETAAEAPASEAPAAETPAPPKRSRSRAAAAATEAPAAAEPAVETAAEEPAAEALQESAEPAPDGAAEGSAEADS